MVRALVVLALMAGCNDDRKRVASDIFLCNADSHTADFDCGDGYRCYAGVQALGDSVCVPECDPDNPKSCPDGVCTVGHECLQRCSVDPKLHKPCPSPGGGILSCVRTTYSPIELADGNDGVCVPVAFSCTDSKECASPIFDLCTSETDGQQYNGALPKTGSACVQGKCQANGAACEPGSSCVRDLIPLADSRAPDVCSPNCQNRKLPDGSYVLQCPPGFGCLNQIFPQTTTRVCAPGLPGWPCSDPLACVAGTCTAWSDVGGVFDGFTTCAPKCENDHDCLVYDQPQANPNMLNHFTCAGGGCRQLAAIFNTAICAHDKDMCRLDMDNARCKVFPPSNADGGAADECNPLAALTGGPAGAICIRPCPGGDSECATLTANSHVTFACAGGVTCIPSIPFSLACTNDGSCMPGLNCIPAPSPLPPIPVCTHACDSSDDCAKNPALGSNFFCLGNVCTPKWPSGCKPPPAASSDYCLSGKLGADGMTCVSPNDWVCDRDDRCQSGKCDLDTHHCM